MRTVLNFFLFLIIFLSVGMFSYARDKDSGKDRGASRSGGGGDKGGGGGGKGGGGGGKQRSAQQRAQRDQKRAATRQNVKQRDNKPNLRSPSMSREAGRQRAANRPQGQRPAGGQQVSRPQVQRPAGGQQVNRPQVQRPSGGQQVTRPQGQRPAGGQQDTRPQVQQRPRQDDRDQNRRVDRDQLRQRWEQNRKDRRPQQVNPQITDKKRQDFREHHKDRWDKDRKFSRDTKRYLNKRYPNYRNWFHDHGRHSHYWNDRVNWWRRPYWNNVYGWLGWGAAAYPIYYDDYGYPVQLNYDVSTYDQSYIDNSINTTYQQPIAAAPVEGDWLPLGVFAVGSSPQEAAYSTIFMQLAVNKQGDIAGTYFNSATGQAFEMDGDVDSQTQLATWQISQGASPAILVTGIYNLTQDVASVQVTFPGGSVQNWTLVRIDDSPDDET